MVSVEDVQGNTFRYSSSRGDIFSEAITFHADGSILNSPHTNETSWRVVDGVLSILNDTGKVTSTYKAQRKSKAGLQLIHGHFVDDDSYLHILSNVSSESVSGITEIFQEELLCDQNPYLYARDINIDEGYPHTNIIEECVDSILAVVKPNFWLEIGSMLGGSAIKTAERIRAGQMNTEIICMDPFTGDVNMWAWERELVEKDAWRFLGVKEGRPTIYDRFLANCKASGHSDIILPICCSSLVGISLMHRLYSEGRLLEKPSVIYLDSAHEPMETLIELRKAWDLLESGGVLFGDDWGWPSVRNDVVEFSGEISVNKDVLNPLREKLEAHEMVGNILLYKGQWILAK